MRILVLFTWKGRRKHVNQKIPHESYIIEYTIRCYAFSVSNRKARVEKDEKPKSDIWKNLISGGTPGYRGMLNVKRLEQIHPKCNKENHLAKWNNKCLNFLFV